MYVYVHQHTLLHTDVSAEIDIFQLAKNNIIRMTHA